MEAQLKLLEARANRREKELTVIVEDVKANSKLERIRLEALHQSECREKDEQLMHFQNDLEHLVRTLRQFQDGSNVNTPNVTLTVNSSLSKVDCNVGGISRNNLLPTS